MLEQLNMTNQRSICSTFIDEENVILFHVSKSYTYKISFHSTNSVYAICPVYICGKCYCKEWHKTLQKMFDNVQFGWVVKKYEMR